MVILVRNEGKSQLDNNSTVVILVRNEGLSSTSVSCGDPGTKCGDDGGLALTGRYSATASPEAYAGPPLAPCGPMNALHMPC